MKTSHHFLAVLLAVLLCLSLTACGDSSDDVTGDDWRTSGAVSYTSDAADEEDSVDLGGRRIIKKKKKKKKEGEMGLVRKHKMRKKELSDV